MKDATKSKRIRITTETYQVVTVSAWEGSARESQVSPHPDKVASIVMASRAAPDAVGMKSRKPSRLLRLLDFVVRTAKGPASKPGPH